jgi:competence ComEA-like helix-hairpin-helix protein
LDGIWTVSQRRGLIAILAAITLALAVRLILNPRTIPNPQPPEGPAAAQLQDRIDPNQATAAELAAIPGLGEKRAADIVQYRQNFSKDHPNRLAFSNILDLQRVSGIGAGLTETMDPYLIFPSQSATRP